MRILTVRQPWAWAIFNGKDVENRKRNIAGDYRGPVAVHAGMLMDDRGLCSPLVRPALDSMPQRRYADDVYGTRGHIIGVVDLIDVHSASVIDGCGRIRHNCPEHGTCRDHCSPWAEGPSPAGGWLFHLVLRNPRPLTEPIPFKGALGLRRLDEGMVARIEAAIA